MCISLKKIIDIISNSHVKDESNGTLDSAAISAGNHLVEDNVENVDFYIC